MERREFLAGTAAGFVAAAGLTRSARAQGSQSNPAPASPGVPAQVDPAKLARIAIMTLDFQNILKLPGQPDSPARTLEIFDVPQMYADVYGVHNIEMQHSHIVSTEDSYLKELRARVEKTQSRITNINLEFGGMSISATDPAMRVQAIDLTNRWVDHAVMLGCPRVMINQGQLTDDTKVWAVPALKNMVEYGNSKGIRVGVETRGNGAGGGGGRGGARGAVAGAPAASAPVGPPPEPTVFPAWVLLREVIKNAGAYANVDIGNVNAQTQGELHAALRALLPITTGNIHTRVNQYWDLATALKFMTKDLGYTGLFSIEANGGHEAVRNVYSVIVANI
jgi:sugar phosphate isomerase/epimerase